MRSLDEIGAALEQTGSPASAYLQAGEDILCHWVEARGLEPTEEEREGFRLLALHRQGAKGDPASMPAGRPAGNSPITTIC